MGNLAGAIFLYFSLAALAVIGLWFTAYSAHLFLSIVEQTAAGSDDVAFPDEPFVDWLWKGVYFWGLAALGPLLLWFVLRNFAEPPQPMTRAVLSTLIVWLVFPLFLLSSLSSTSLLVLVRWHVLQRLAQRWDAAAAFLLVSVGCPFGVALANVALLFGRSGLAPERETQALIIGVPFVSILSIFLLFLYVRMIGRLGWIIRPHRVPKKRKKRDHLPITSPEPSTLSAPPTSPRAIEDDENAATFGLREEESTAPVPLPRSASAEEDEDDDEDEDEVPNPNLPVKSWTELLRPSVFFFPLYENGRGPMLWLTVGWALLLAFVLVVSGLYASRFAAPREAPAEETRQVSPRGPSNGFATLRRSVSSGRFCEASLTN